MPPQQRGEKHPRAQSTISRDAKRIRDDETTLSEMSVDPIEDLQKSDKRLGKRRQESEDDDESTTEVGADEDDEEGESTTIDDDEEWLVQQQQSTRKNKGKVARTNNVDSPSNTKRRIKKGKKDPFITSPPGQKASNKRILDDSEDHEVGTEWEDLNGLRWRMGEDRELRREAVVMEMRLKYPNMPKDSRHPDAKIKIPVFVEKFLTEQEYEELKSKKLLGFQEEERQREIDDAEEKRRKKEEEESKERQRVIAERGERTIATPKKVRDVQALYQSPFRKPASVSPLRGVLPLAMQRSRSASSVSSRNSTSSTIMPSPSVPYKRLSLSMGSKDDVSASSKSVPASPDASKQETISKPKRSTNSLRIPLSSPSSSRQITNQTSSSTPSPLKRILGSLSSIVARTKREESILKILKEEDERRKKRETSTVK